MIIHVTVADLTKAAVTGACFFHRKQKGGSINNLFRPTKGVGLIQYGGIFLFCSKSSLDATNIG